MSETSLQAVKIVKIYPTEFWYEKDMMGTMSLKAQHEGMHECTLVQIPYDYAYTSNAGQWALLQHLCKYFGLLKDIEQRPSKFDAELIRQATSVDAIDGSAGHVDKTANDRHELTDAKILEIFEVCDGGDREVLANLVGVENLLRRARNLLKEAGHGWISVSDKLPDDGQNVAFVVKSEQHDWLHGRILGGRYTTGISGGFSVPGMHVLASHWMPLPDAPDA